MKSRISWMPQALTCFLSQTYPKSKRELLILADGDGLRNLVKLLPNGETVRLVEISGASTIGSKRNLGCELATGDVIAHWDDDDFSASGRLTEQVEALVQSGRAVAGYHTMRFTDGARWWQFRGTRSTALGTSLCYRRIWWETHRSRSCRSVKTRALQPRPSRPASS